jgi:polyhydroxybutyrate depolymerase
MCRIGPPFLTLLVAHAAFDIAVYGQGQVLERRLVHDRLQRDYTLYVPPNYAPESALPLVINMHGHTIPRTIQMLATGMNAVAAHEGFLVAYPDAVNANWFEGQDNVGFIDSVLRDISSQYSVDASRVYATGFSQGGAMSYILGAERPYTFAAIAPVAGVANVLGTPSRPLPLLHMHGTADTIVPYAQVEQLLPGYVTRNGGSFTPSITNLPDLITVDGSTVQLHAYRGSPYLDNSGDSREAEVLFYRIQNGGHSWPSGSIGSMPINYDISASAEIWKFFSRHEVAAIPISTWNVDAGGNWFRGANWAGAVPNLVGVRAVFGDAITKPTTVTNDRTAVVGRLDFDSEHAFTIEGPSMLRIAGGDAQINVMRGSHVIAAPITLGDDTLITVAPADGNLSMTAALTAAAVNLTKAGAGTLTVNNIRAKTLAVNGGTVAIAPHGSSAAWNELSLAGAPSAWTAKLDLANHDAVARSTAASKIADFNRLHNQLKQGFDNGTWTGMGIASTSAAINPSMDTGLTVIDNAGLGLSFFSGQSITANSILLKYTYYGDVDLNGQVDPDDLTVFANNFGRATGATQIDGDIDFDSDVDADDLTVFANNFAKGIGNPLGTAEIAAVPEPGSVVLLFAGLVVLALTPRARRCMLIIVLTALGLSTPAHADIFRWDNGQVIPGTEGILPGRGMDLTNRDLDFADLAGEQLAGSKFDNSHLRNARLTDANLRSATLPNADLGGAFVTGADFSFTTSRGFVQQQLYSTASYQAKDLRGVSFELNDLSGWDFADQNLGGADFRSTTLTNVNFHGANLTGATLSYATLQDANLTGADVTEADFSNRYARPGSIITKEQLYSTASYQVHDLRGIKLLSSDLTGWNFHRQDLRGANFNLAVLTDADFSDAWVRGAALVGATSRGLARGQLYSTASYKKLDLAEIQLSGNLTGWDFSGQNLARADLTGANLVDANMSGANLTGAGLFGAMLRNANFTTAVVSGADLQLSTDFGFTKEQLYSTASYQAKDLRGIKLNGFFDWGVSRTHLAGWDFNAQDLTGSDLAYATLTNANLSKANLTNVSLGFAVLNNADLSGAIVHGANFDSTMLTKEQLYSTASYQAKDLHTIGLRGNDLASWDLTGQNLTGAYFDNVIITNTNLTSADARGASGLQLVGAITTNLIRPDGRIIGLNLAAGEKLVAHAGVPIPVKFGSDFFVAPTATFDLTNNDAIVTSTAATKAADLARLNDFVKQGHNGGNWQGNGITSSTAAADANKQTTLAVADNALLGYTNFSGQPVTADSILLKYTYYGDVDLNGQVDADDLTVFANNFGRATGAVQTDGDLDFDGAVDADDLTAFANNLGKALDIPLIFSSVKAIPEPTSLAVAGLGTMSILGAIAVRRWRRS